MAEQPELRSRLAEIPHQPGIYLMKDRLGSVIYVGKARDLRKRLASYFMPSRSEEHTSELQSRTNLVCRLLLEKKKTTHTTLHTTAPQLSLPRFHTRMSA